MSHLPPQDLLTVKQVSRRFYTLVTSPTAWSNAFAKYFPGPESLHPDVSRDEDDRAGNIFHTEARVFTRLSASVSWSSEYLSRTRLLRALVRGRPSLPFAAPCPGKPGKGSATFTFSSRIWRGCTTLDADFGSIFDKRKPQFVHGSALSGSVTSSDRRGKFDAWGFSDSVFFRHFHEIHPGTAPFGLDAGTCVGLPNMMEVSQQHGMLYGEGTPGGSVHFLGGGEKHTRILTAYTGISNRNQGIPTLSSDTQCPTSLWIARSASMPRITQGMIGILVGSSNGILTAYSLGPQGSQRYERGEMTARWALSPGVPIIAIAADDQYSEDRARAGRVWGLALNALGELFYIKDVVEPAPKPPTPRNATPEEMAEREEFISWQTGYTRSWYLVQTTLRQSRYENSKGEETLESLPSRVFGSGGSLNLSNETARLQSWFAKTPIEIRSEFTGWDMRRRLLVDFAGDDGDDAGESGVVISDGADGSLASITRFKRSRGEAGQSEHTSNTSVEMSVAQSSWSFADIPKGKQLDGSKAPVLVDQWLHSTYLPALTQVTATGLDNSIQAITTLAEDERLQKARATMRHGRAPQPESPSSPIQNTFIPGRRARLFAAGTSAGFVFIWDMRAPTSKTMDLTNEIQPVRVIVTVSPGIASIALSSLYLVHGGTEGLLQAWDLLASTTEPIRTLSSRRLVNNRRRAILAAHQLAVPTTWAAQNTERLAASAICLDPDPTVLRGVATIDSWIKYWSFSSATSAEEMSRSQKRKLKKGSGSKNPGLTDGGEAEMGWSGFSGSQRRTNLKGYVSHEMHLREMDEADRHRASKEDRRFAGRFGTELLGANASEEEMLAYATMLSQEENEKQLRRAAESSVKLSKNASIDEVEAHRALLNEQDAEKWKFASWKQRFEMLPDGGVALPPEAFETQNDTATPTAEDPEMRRAVELSIEAERKREREAASPLLDAPGPSKQVDAQDLQNDPDLAEAIALSLTTEQGAASPPELLLGTISRKDNPDTEEDELERAIRLSLADQSSSSPPTEPHRRGHADNDDFPGLPSSSPPSGSRSAGKGKGKKGAW